jgi:hypothetical protein
MRDSNKAKLSKILEVALANQRASKDLQGIIGIKGSFTFNAAGTAVSDVVGTGFEVEAVSGTAGAFRVYLDTKLENVLGVKALAFTEKLIGAASDDFEVDCSGWDMDVARPYVSFRCVAKATPFAVQAPGADCSINFEINGTYSDETGY